MIPPWLDLSVPAKGIPLLLFPPAKGAEGAKGMPERPHPPPIPPLNPSPAKVIPPPPIPISTPKFLVMKRSFVPPIPPLPNRFVSTVLSLDVFGAAGAPNGLCLAAPIGWFDAPLFFSTLVSLTSLLGPTGAVLLCRWLFCFFPTPILFPPTCCWFTVPTPTPPFKVPFPPPPFFAPPLFFPPTCPIPVCCSLPPSVPPFEPVG